MAATVETFVRDARGEVVPALVPDPSMVRLEPVKRLMLAVLDRAVNDFRTYAVVPTGRGRRLFAEVEAWFHSSTDGAFDFETICQATELDPDFIRSGLRSSYGAGSRQAPIGMAPKATRAVAQWPTFPQR